MAEISAEDEAGGYLPRAEDPWHVHLEDLWDGTEGRIGSEETIDWYAPARDEEHVRGENTDLFPKGIPIDKANFRYDFDVYACEA